MKKNWKLIIINVLIGIIISTVGIVTAQTIINSSEVTYDNSKSNGSFSNVQNSLDELYNRAGYTGEEYHEEILHGADPVLSGELVPVYLADNGDVYYANTHTSWYSYYAKKWANAVILVDDAYAKNRQDNKDKYMPGDKISEQDIESYFVWIPRYAYKIWDLGNYTSSIDAKTLNSSSSTYETSPGNITGKARIIDVVFGNKEYLTGANYLKQTRNSETGLISDPAGIKVGDYLVHPAFTLGTKELDGFWIGKFETSISNNKINVKPNKTPYLASMYEMFNKGYEYKRNLDSHMLKNTEWGAVAYLSHSSYGKGSEVNINNNYLTGYSAFDSDQSSYPGETGSNKSKSYETPAGYLASTTGNITGVYDMAGGFHDFVAATIVNNGVKPVGDQSGFEINALNQFIKDGYIDVYPSDSSATNYSKRILGDATGEMGPFYSYREVSVAVNHNSWYSDYSIFVSQAFPWFARGGVYSNGIIGGIFLSEGSSGKGSGTGAFHLALTGKSA